MTKKQFIKYILHKNGNCRQCIKAIEEMTELTHVLARYAFDGELDRDNLGEELADVFLCCYELAECFDVSNLELEQRMQSKIDRYCGGETVARKNESLEHTAGG